MVRTHRWAWAAAVAALLVGITTAQADVRLPHIFGTHMVLQRDVDIPVWGWADVGEKVTVQLGNMAAVATEAGEDGKWRVALPPAEAGGPLSLVVTANNSVVIEDVLIGEVWVCSGQSNMQFGVGSSDNAQEEIANANYPQIRHLTAPRRPTPLPVGDFDAAWQVCSPQTAGGFSAAAYFFGRHLNLELGVPIGLVNSSWGGTLIEPWTPREGFAQVEVLKDILDKVVLTDPASEPYKTRLHEYIGQLEAWVAQAKTALADSKPLEPAPAYPPEIAPLIDHQQPTVLYNGMIKPLVPFAIRGAIWYQGESNRLDGKLYTEKMRALIGGWRQAWGLGEFPFYYVQIAPYGYGAEDPFLLANFWQAQTDALTIPNTGMAVINDIGDLADIHPRNKQDVGLRLALLALANTYGRQDVVCSGPTYKSMALEGARIRVQFDNIGSGLASRDGEPLTWFEIIGQETDFVKAEAVIEGDTIVLSAPEVKQAAAMRFAWHKNAEPNFMNREGLPARPFRAGEVPDRDWLALKVPEAADYTLVYDLDIAKIGREITYETDNSKDIAGAFDRIAYFLELQKAGGATKYAYVSMDAFTDDISKIGVPAIATKAKFQQTVGNMNVISNVDGIVNGAGLTGGNIEFWSYNYGPPNEANVPNASASVWDFGDQPGPPEDGYGCMQIHNHEAKQTIFALNAWKSGPGADLGIGNSDGDTRDWTFKANAGTYSAKKLRVLVRLAK